MKKLVSLVLSLLITLSATVTVFAKSTDLAEPSVHETSEIVTEESKSDLTIEGHPIPAEPEIVWKTENWASTVNEYDDTIDLLSATDDTSGIIVSRAYRNSILVQKTLYDVESAVMYTEIYKGNTDKEVIVEDKEDYIRIVVEKPVSAETLDQVFRPIHKAPQSTSYSEPPLDDD